jgi:prefoldin alpha subunit
MENKMTNEKELQKYMIQIEQYKEQLNSLDIQFSYIQSAITDQTKAKITLENLDKSDENVDVMCPIGGGAYFNATTKKTSKVLFDIGDGVVIEKNSVDVIKKIDERINNLHQTEEKISSMAQQLQSELAEISNKAEKILSNRI